MYDLLIIGLGPAGMTASIYASRYRLKHLIIGQVLGGSIVLSGEVGNVPAFPSTTGLEWSKKVEEQIKTLGAEVAYDTVTKIEKIDGGYKVTDSQGRQFEAKTLILAAGSERKKLNIPGEDTYQGKGVSFCTTCDVPFYKDKVVIVIGGANAAVSGAVHAAAYAKRVYIIYRKEELRAEPIWIEQARANSKIEIIYETNVVAIEGDGQKVTGAKLDHPYNGQDLLLTDGIFIEIGSVPGLILARNLGLELNEVGYLKVTDGMSTNLPGVFAAGDITDKGQLLAQLITACAQGAMAAASAFKFLKGEKAPKIY